MNMDYMQRVVKTYVFDKEEFEVEWERDVPYLKVSYKDQVGYVGVNPKGTTLYPYNWVANAPEALSPQGLQWGNVPLFDGDLESCLIALCRDLVYQQAAAERAQAMAEMPQGLRALQVFMQEM